MFFFNPFAEGWIARGDAYAPVKHQSGLAEDLANLPQFLCEPGDIVLVPEKPSARFLEYLSRAGFSLPDFVVMGDNASAALGTVGARKLGPLRPWAWGPDALKLLQPLFPAVRIGGRLPGECFNKNIARLYSKAWSSQFLREVLLDAQPGESWVCGEHEAGVTVDNIADALEAVAAIRDRGQHRVVVKEAYGLAGHNAIRLWEPEILPAQRLWLERATQAGRLVVVEPWMDREVDFSIQLEMTADGLHLSGCTGLINDLKGQFLANWAEPGHRCRVPSAVLQAFTGEPVIDERVQHLYAWIFDSLESRLRQIGFQGPISIDAFVYRTPDGKRKLKPVVEINPRYTMGRVTVELMKHTFCGASGLFRIVSSAQARKEGFAGLASYGCELASRKPLLLEREPVPRIRRGALCLNDAAQARVCLATYEVIDAPHLPGRLAEHLPFLSHPRL